MDLGLRASKCARRAALSGLLAISLQISLHIPSVRAAAIDQQPGTKLEVRASELPEPSTAPPVGNFSSTVPKAANETLKVPPGFAVSVFASNLGNARNLAVATNGDVFVVDSNGGNILLLRDDDGRGTDMVKFAEGFRRPHGLVIGKDALLVGDLDGIWRIPYTAGDKAARAKQIRVTADGAIGDPSGHATRNVALSSDGTKFYVAIGSRGNINEEPAPRATVQEFAIDGSQQRTFASGLRNCVGLGFYPGTRDLYCAVNERDGLGDELPPDYFTKVQDGGFYGWPYSYIGNHPQPNFADKHPEMVAKAITPDVLFHAHSAPISLAFYTASQFPAAYRGGAFVTLHGSWNAANPRGYMVAYVPFAGGKPEGDYIVFATGFWRGNTDHPEVWDRPAGLAIEKDGSLLVTGDITGTIWRITYKGR